MKLAFGIVAQGHIETIEFMLFNGCSWAQIAKQIGWADEKAVQRQYDRYLDSKKRYGDEVAK